jgi:hypothetical protein
MPLLNLPPDALPIARVLLARLLEQLRAVT